MKAVTYAENGPPSVLCVEDVPEPSCGPAEVVIQVGAIAVEGGDTFTRATVAPASTPFIVGLQAAGTIIEVGADVVDRFPGQVVTTFARSGSHAERRAVLARDTWIVPEGMDLRVAAAVPVPFGTAHDALFEVGRLRPGETVLVQAGASGVGLAAVQLAKRAGATVAATASTDEKLRFLSKLGVDHTISSTTSDPVRAVRAATDGRGVDLAIDIVGVTLQQSVACLADRGRAVLVGGAGRQTITLDPTALKEQYQSVHGMRLGAVIGSERVHAMIQELIHRVDDGQLAAILDADFRLEDAVAAHTYVEGRTGIGRVTLRP